MNDVGFFLFLFLFSSHFSFFLNQPIESQMMA